MSAALKLNLEDEKLSRKPPLGEKRPKLRLVWENPNLSHGTQKEKPEVKPGSSYGRVLYNYHRDYDPDTGRYLQPDPIGLAGGLNPYVYANANPLRYTDLLGLQAAAAALPYPNTVPSTGIIPNWLRPPSPWWLLFWPQPVGAGSDIVPPGPYWNEDDEGNGCPLPGEDKYSESEARARGWVPWPEVAGGTPIDLPTDPPEDPRVPEGWVRPKGGSAPGSNPGTLINSPGTYVRYPKKWKK